MRQDLEAEFTKGSRMPIWVVLGAIAICGVVCWQVVQRMGQMGAPQMGFCPQRDVYVLFSVARSAIWQAVLFAGGLFYAWRLLRAKVWAGQLGVAVGLLKLFGAIFAAINISGATSVSLVCHVPSSMNQMPGLKGWCPYEIIDLAILACSLVGLMVLADWFQDKIMSARALCGRLALSGCAVAVFCLLKAIPPLGHCDHHLSSRDGLDHQDDQKEESGQLDHYRLSDDEPWEVNG
mgnify:CR=1 FL=1